MPGSLRERALRTAGPATYWPMTEPAPGRPARPRPSAVARSCGWRRSRPIRAAATRPASGSARRSPPTPRCSASPPTSATRRRHSSPPTVGPRRAVPCPLLQPARRGPVLRPRDDRQRRRTGRARTRGPARARWRAAAIVADHERRSGRCRHRSRRGWPYPSDAHDLVATWVREPEPALLSAALDAARLARRRARSGASARGRVRRREAPHPRRPRPRRLATLGLPVRAPPGADARSTT